MKALYFSFWRTCVAAGISAAVLSACSSVPHQSSTTSSSSQTAQPDSAAQTSAIQEPSIFTRMIESPQTTALRNQIAQQGRLYRVAAPLLTKNILLCNGFARNLLGFTAQNKYAYPPDLIESAQALGFEDRLMVTGVLPNSGAQQNGLQVHDILVRVEGKPFPQGPDADRQTALLLGPLVSSKNTIRLNVERKKQTQDITVPLTQACAFNIELGNSDIINSYSDGRRVLITKGMLQFTQNDTELAYVIAIEMARNILGQANQQRMVATIGEVIDNLLRLKPDETTLEGMSGIRPYSSKLDEQADILALYLLARAGYDIEQTDLFWQRLANAYPATVLNSYTALHPDINHRIETIHQIRDAIRMKQSANQDLVP